MSSQSGVALPSTLPEFIANMKKGIVAQVTGTVFNSLLGFVTLGAAGKALESFGFGDIPVDKQQLVKYSGSALLHGRPLNALVIMVAGQTGRGKSTTIQRFFDDTIYNSEIERTMTISVYEKQLTATAEKPPIIGRIKFIDFPGSLDEDPERGVENFARLLNFRMQHPELADRATAADNADLRRYDLNPRNEVYPNLVLLVGSASDRRITPPNSDFRKSAAYLKASGTVDNERVNLIVVITHALDLDYTHFQLQCDNIKAQVRLVVHETFGIPTVRVVFVENKFENRVGEMDGDFFILPNGEQNYGNLKQAMQNMFRYAHDYIAMQFTSHYFAPMCPEKRIKPTQTCTDTQSYKYAPSASQREEARNILQELQMYSGANPTQTPFQFSYFGNGYCPKAETSRHIDLFNSTNYNVSREFGHPLRIPTNVRLASISTLENERLSFVSKDKYEEHKSRKLGLGAEFHLKVTGNVGVGWGGSSELDNGKEILKFSFSFCYGTIQMQDVENHLGSKLSGAIHALPPAFDKLTSPKFDLFFDRYGTHLITHIKVGGSIGIEVHLEKAKFGRTERNSFELNMETALKTQFLRSMSGGVSVQNNSMREMLSQTCFSHVKFEGGNPPLNVSSISDLTPELLAEWVLSVKESNQVTELIDTIQVSPYYLMAATDENKLALKDATADYLRRNPPCRDEGSSREQMAQEHAAAAKRIAETAASDGSCCFSGTTTVHVMGRGPVPIPSLQYGDVLLSASPQLELHRSKFLTFLHYDPNKTSLFQAIRLDNGMVLEVTGGHILFQSPAFNGEPNGTMRPITASNVKVGNFLLVGSNDSGTSTPSQVTSVQTVTRTGVYCPYVDGGTLLANNVVVSCFSDLDMFPLAVAEACLLPLNCWLQLTNRFRELAYGNPTVFKDGIHPYAKALKKFSGLLKTTRVQASLP